MYPYVKSTLFVSKSKDFSGVRTRFGSAEVSLSTGKIVLFVPEAVLINSRHLKAVLFVYRLAATALQDSHCSAIQMQYKSKVVCESKKLEPQDAGLFF